MIPLQYAKHRNSSYYITGGYFIKRTILLSLKEKKSKHVCVTVLQRLSNAYQLFVVACDYVVVV